jgi:cytochrome c oxidase subunit 1
MCSRSSRLLGAWRTTPAAAPLAYYELLFWGGGHVLQAGNVALMLALWLHLLQRWTGRAVLSPATVTALMTALIAPQVVMPWLAFAGTTGTAYFTMATHLMRWTLFPVVLVVLGTGVLHVWRSPDRPAWGDFRFAGLAGSAALTLLGFILGSLIRGSSTLVPGHYHCAIGAVTIALMAAAYDFCTAVAPPARRSRNRAARGCNSCSSAAGRPSSASDLPWPAPTAWAASNTASSSTCAPPGSISG